MKKAFIILVMALVVFSASASAKGDIKVGGQVGYEHQSTVFSAGSMSSNYTASGVLISATGQYYLSDDISIKAEAGLTINGRPSIIIKAYDEKEIQTGKSNTPVHFAGYIGGVYDLQLTKEVSLGIGAGLDVLAGRIVSYEEVSEDFDPNVGIGLGVEAVGSYKVNRQLRVTLGGRFAWHFINTSKAYATIKEESEAVLNQFAFQITAGVTYAL